MELCYSHRAVDLDFKYIDTEDSSSRRVIMTCILPLAQIVTDFFDKLKSHSCGFASFEYVPPLIDNPTHAYSSVTRMLGI